jgi:hypothetical protein
MKSTTCTGANGQFLEEYHSQTAAELAAEELQRTFDYILTPFYCSFCAYWHLTAEITRKQCYHCTDSALFLKDIYASKADAESTATWLKREKKIQLYAYKCPHSAGWHLTKKDPVRKRMGKG